MGGQTALNTALGLHRRRRARKIRRRNDRRARRGDRQGRGPRALPRGDEEDRPRMPRSVLAHDLIEALAALRRSACPPSSARPSRSAAPAAASPITARNSRDRRARPRRLADLRSAGRGIGARLEGIRDGGRPRPRRQLHHHLLDREYRSDGRAHRRLDHGRAGADADRQGISDACATPRSRCCARSASRPAARTCSSRSTRPTGAWSSSR